VSHAVSHERSEHSSIIKFVDEMFHLVPLADLPDEERAREIGRTSLGQSDLGPADDKVEGVGDLFSGFDNLRLLGRRSPIAPIDAEIPEAAIRTFPHLGGHGCSVLNIKPTDAGKSNPIPDDFNPRPDTTPGLPRSGNWIP
jgi:phospholipase C